MAKITFRGLVEIPSSRLTEDVMASLYATAKHNASVPGKPDVFPIYAETGNGTVLVPRWAYINMLREPGDKIVVDEMKLLAKPREFTGTLYAEQVPGANELLRILAKTHGALGKGRCGSGKTVIGVNMISRIKADKTVVLIDQTNLADQWALSILKYLPETTFSLYMPIESQKRIYDMIGVTRPGKMYKEDTRGDVVIVMAQTLMRKDSYDDPIKASLLIVDEAHKFSAPCFSKSIFHISFRYSLALTATDERRDGLSWIFKAILGEKTAQLAGRRMTPMVIHIPVTPTVRIQLKDHRFVWCNADHSNTSVYTCRTCSRDPRPPPKCGWGKVSDKIHFTQVFQRMANDANYISTVVRAAKLAHEFNRQVIIFSKYKDHLKLLRKETIALGVPEEETSLYFGGMSKDKLDAPLTFATVGVAKHGLDVPRKDTVIFACSVTEAEQYVGRIERIVEGEYKPNPVVIDLVMTGEDFFKKQWWARKAFYRRAKYDVESGDLGVARAAFHRGMEGKQPN